MIKVTDIICGAWVHGNYSVRPVKPVKRRKTLGYILAQFHANICSMRMYFTPVSPVSERFYLLK